MSKHLFTWWESKRVGYNILLFVLSSILLLAKLDEYLLFFGWLNICLQTIYYLFFANLFFSMGWGIEILSHYYFKRKKWSMSLRNFLYYAGVLFSILLTIRLYSMAIALPY